MPSMFSISVNGVFNHCQFGSFALCQLAECTNHNRASSSRLKKAVAAESGGAVGRRAAW